MDYGVFKRNLDGLRGVKIEIPVIIDRFWQESSKNQPSSESLLTPKGSFAIVATTICGDYGVFGEELTLITGFCAISDVLLCDLKENDHINLWSIVTAHVADGF